MERYHFHTKDGRCLADKEGALLSNVGAAKDIAVQVLCDSLKNNSKMFWETSEFSVVVTDDSGLMLFTVDLSANPSPVLGAPL